MSTPLVEVIDSPGESLLTGHRARIGLGLPCQDTCSFKVLYHTQTQSARLFQAKFKDSLVSTVSRESHKQGLATIWLPVLSYVH